MRRVAMAPDEDDRPGAGDAVVVGDCGGDVMGGQRRRRSRCDAAGEQPGGAAGGACGAAAGDGMHAPVLTGDEGPQTYRALVAFAKRQGLTVTTHDPKADGDDTQSTYNGYYSPARNLIFVKRAAPAQMVKTLAHELAHHLDPELQAASRAECETVAEATAFVVAAHHHIDTGNYSFPYIATWASRQDGPLLLKQVMGRVQTIAHRLIGGITPADQRSAERPDLP